MTVLNTCTYLCLSSVLFPMSADSCWMRDRRTGCCRGQGLWLNTWEGLTVSHTNTTKSRLDADSAWNIHSKMSDLPTSTLHIKKTQNIKLFFAISTWQCTCIECKPKILYKFKSLNTCWNAVLSWPCLRRFRIWVWTWWGSGVTWTGVTAPDLMASRTLSLMLAPCSLTAILTSSFTACLTYRTIVSSRLQWKHILYNSGVYHRCKSITCTDC